MIANLQILVVGAGAAGLAFALECANGGQKVRIIDKRTRRSLIGKATGITAGAWAQLAKYQISPSSVAQAIPMRNFAFYDEGELVANMAVPLIAGHPPAHLYPQGELEQHLEKALLSKGVTVEYGIEFVSYRSHEKCLEVRARNADGETCVLGNYTWLIGADGAHSEVRKAADMPMIGKDYPDNWSVAEITTKQWPRDVQAQVLLQSDGVGMFLSQPAVGAVQGILNADNAVERLMSQFSDAALRYERHFKVALQRVVSPNKGRVWLIGDAAHVQSPVGGQGLNLAIWDGITLASGLLSDDPKVATTLANRARRVLWFTDFDYRMLTATNRLVRSARNTYWRCAQRYPLLARWFFKLISGLW